MPPTIKYFYELLQLIKKFDPSYASLEVKHCLEHEKCEAELEEAECIVDEILEMMRSPLPHAQKQPEEKFVIKENYIKPLENPYSIKAGQVAEDIKKGGKDVLNSFKKLF